jgi:hypothetical protein
MPLSEAWLALYFQLFPHRTALHNVTEGLEIALG